MKLRGQLYVTTLIIARLSHHGRFDLMNANNSTENKYNILSIFKGKFKEQQVLSSLPRGHYFWIRH